MYGCIIALENFRSDRSNATVFEFTLSTVSMSPTVTGSHSDSMLQKTEHGGSLAYPEQVVPPRPLLRLRHAAHGQRRVGIS